MGSAGQDLIVVARKDAALRAAPSGLTSMAGYDTAPLNEVCQRYGGTMRPLFGASEDRLIREAAQVPSHVDAPDLSVYYRVDAPADRLHDIAAVLLAQPLVAAAYVKPRPEPAAVLLDLPARAEEAPAATPDSRTATVDGAISMVSGGSFIERTSMISGRSASSVTRTGWFSR
jgi:hypothetical protein